MAKLSRRQRLSLMAIRGGLRALNLFSTHAAAGVAAQLFLRPPPPPRARNVAGDGERLELTTGAGRALAWKYGSGPVVYLLHGWGGRGFQLSSFVPPLVAAGRTAVMLDAPAHGESGGQESSVMAFARTLRSAVQTLGPASGVIAHSLGAMSTIVGLADGLRVDRIVFLAPGSNLDEASRRFQRTVGLAPRTLEVLRQKMETRFHLTWADYELARLELRSPLWVVHDREDEDVPLSETEDLVRHWPGAQLEITHGLGHYRLLRNAEVIGQAVRFLTAPVL
jgi:pimeloyl-ACP methyl ester carboxylesterase